MTRARKSRVSDPPRTPPRRRALVLLAVTAALLATGLVWVRLRSPSGAGASVLLITLDTVRADRIGAYGAADARTPHLDALARGGVLFEEALASTPLTLPSHATLLSGQEPPRHGVRDNGVSVFPERETLATVLKARGYATGAFVGAYVLDRRFGLARGFDHYGDRIERRAEGPSVLESERRGETVVAEATDWLASQSSPFLAWVHLYDAHAPYDPPPPFREQFAGRLYDGEVSYVDACVGRILAAARARAGARLVVAVVADHGEGLGEHGERTHGFFVYRSTLRIPFVLAGPGIPVGERRAGLARTVDLLPSVLARLGVPVPRGVEGTDLLAGPSRGDAYAETVYPQSLGWAPLFSFRTGSLKYVDAPRPELYDVIADPGEGLDLSSVRPQDVDRLRRALAAFRGNDRLPSGAATDPAVAERLRSLGYVGGASAPADPRDPTRDPKDALPLWRRYEEALWAEARGEHTVAVTALSGLVKDEPTNATFRRSLAAALRQAGRAREAIVALTDVDRLAPDDALAWHERAIALAAADRVEDAVQAEERAIALNPLLPEPLNHLGVLESRRARPAAALAAFERAIGLDPNNALAWSNRGNALRAVGRLEEARNAYETAARLAPAGSDAWNGLGVLAVQRNDLHGAASLFRRVLELDPGHLEASLNLAFTDAQQGRTDEARSRLRDLLGRSKDPELTRRARGLLAELH